MPANPQFDWSAADAYLFDIDGTLLNTRDGIHFHAFRNAMREVFNFDATIEGVPVHGNTDIGILRAVIRRQGVSDQHFESELPRLIQLMSHEVRRRAAEINADVCPSIRHLLHTLHSRGKLLGVVTGNFQDIGWAKLQATGLRKFFQFGSFSDKTEFREDIFRNGLAQVRERMGPDAVTFVVGDTPSDIRAAKAVGIPIISVATGKFPREELAAMAPDLSLGCWTDIFPPETAHTSISGPK